MWEGLRVRRMFYSNRQQQTKYGSLLDLEMTNARYRRARGRCVCEWPALGRLDRLDRLAKQVKDTSRKRPAPTALLLYTILSICNIYCDACRKTAESSNRKRHNVTRSTREEDKEGWGSYFSLSRQINRHMLSLCCLLLPGLPFSVNARRPRLLVRIKRRPCMQIR